MYCLEVLQFLNLLLGINK